MHKLTVEDQSYVYPMLGFRRIGQKLEKTVKFKTEKSTNGTIYNSTLAIIMVTTHAL